MLDALVTGTYAVDTETTGLRAYHGDRLFSLIIASADTSWYFNFQAYKDLADDWVLPREETVAALQPFFANAENVLAMQNAKFDLAMLAAEGIEVGAKIYDTEVLGRLLYNRHMTYGLGAQAKLIGLEKSTAVDDYIKKHKLFSWETPPGKKRQKRPHYDRVPHAVIAPYGEQDGAVTWKLQDHQRRELAKVAEIIPKGKLLELVETEAELVKTCFAMERTGIKIDRGYCERAFAYETDQATAAARAFEAKSGLPFKDANAHLAACFTAAGETYPTTAKGNPSFTDEVLEGFTSPLAGHLRGYRGATKRANTYFANFLYYADAADRIHPNMRQAGTDTGRFSFSDPNLQNVPTDDSGPFPVRRAFVPDDPDYLLVAIDYDQMEYRLLLDYAGDLEVIRAILGGLDVHEATAAKMGVARQAAKTLNFLLLYGGGAQKLADAIGCTLATAEALKAQYFEALPGVRRFSQGVTERANTRGFIFNWAGRVCHFPLLPDPRTGRLSRFAYKAPNHCIQGGGADVVKIAMNRCRRHLAGWRSRMVLQVHDELLFLIHRSELHLVAELKAIMEAAYPHRHLPLTCSVEWSDKSWGDMEPWPKTAAALAEWAVPTGIDRVFYPTPESPGSPQAATR